MIRKLTLFAISLFTASAANAQNDTLLYESFEFDMSTYTVNAPAGTENETNWVNFDLDGFADASGGSTQRPPEWFQTLGFADADTATVVMASNSWTSPADKVSNWLMTPVVYINDTNATLSWKSAPFQTPRYMDGYTVLISTTTNSETDFTDTIFVAAEFVSQSTLVDSTYSRFNFAPANGFVHGRDGSYIEYHGDSVRFTGVLRPFSFSLAQYVGQHIFVAFVHNATDDNLIAIDDILIMGTGVASVNDVQADISLKLFPNPASEIVNISYTLANASPVFFDMYDMNGKLVRTMANGFRPAGEHTAAFNIDGVARGYYNVVVRTAEGNSVKKIMVK